MASQVARRRVAPPEWIEISGFKSVRHPVRVHLRRLTLLAGTNSSGKSSVMQPLLMMKQTLEAPYDPGPLLLDGPHVRFTRPEQFLSRGRRKRDRADAVRVTLGPLERMVLLGRPRRGAPAWDPSPPVRLSFRPGSGTRGDDGLAPVQLEQQVGDRWIALSERMSATDFATAAAAWGKEQARAWTEGDLGVEIHAVTRRFATTFLARPADEERPPLPIWGLAPVDPHLEWIASILHLPGLRGHRERRYPSASVGQDRRLTQVPGPFTAYVASMIIGWQDRDDERLRTVKDGMQALGLTWKVRARRVSAAEVELEVGRTPKATQGGAQDLVDIADVGFGVSQVLPVVVALAAAQPGQLVYVEQPELHLHPRAQHAMGQLLARSAERGVHVVVETHSRIILRAIQTEIARPGGLEPEHVALHWFHRDPDTGYTEVRLADVDRRGAFGDWPIDFTEVEAEADDTWLDAAFGGTDG